MKDMNSKQLSRSLVFSDQDFEICRSSSQDLMLQSLVLVANTMLGAYSYHEFHEIKSEDIFCRIDFILELQVDFQTYQDFGCYFSTLVFPCFVLCPNLFLE